MLRLGVFFDGTGNNLYNDDLIGDGSLSNVAKLYKVYRASGYTAFYSQGVGTGKYKQGKTLSAKAVEAIWQRKKAKNDYYDALHMAFGGDAKSFVKRKLKKVRSAVRQNGGDDVIIDVFGFSRGSAEARDFVNRVNAAHKHDANVRVGFVGLFDTVATIGLANDLNIGFDLDLSNDSAQKIVHLTAEDEHRHNFPLESLKRADGTTEANTEEIALMGVHADIGGGYGELDDRQDVLVKDSEFYRVYPKHKKGQAEQQVNALRKEAEGKGYELLYTLTQLPALSDWALDACFIEHAPVAYGLSNSALQLMYSKAMEHIPALAGLELLGETAAGHSLFEAPAAPDKRYMHFSAVGDRYALSTSDWITNLKNPGGKRRVYFNDPKKAG
ncbi:T6SS phospholipase effector Tle1-like catalytic domain-containing protein [Thiomicrolovo sp. ZZH C-3]